MALRARQEQQLHLAIGLYLESKFPEAYKAFEQEAHIDFSAAGPLSREYERFDGETLPKRWAATARLQARLTLLQQQLQQQEQQLRLFTAAVSVDGSEKAAGLPSLKASCVLWTQRQPVTSAKFHPVLPQLLAGADDGNIRVVTIEEASNAVISRTFRAHGAAVTDLAFNNSGRWLVTSSSDMTLRLFDVQEMYALKKTLRGHSDSVSAVTFCSLGQANKRVGVSDIVHRGISGGNLMSTQQDNAESDENLCLISCSRDGLIKVWHINSGLCLKTLSSNGGDSEKWIGGSTAGSSGSWIRCVCTPEETLKAAPFFASCGNDQKVVIWRLDYMSSIIELAGHEHVVEYVTFASEAMLRHLHIHMKAPSPLPSVMLNQGELLHAEQKTGSSHILRSAGLVVISASRDNTIKIWDALGGTCMQTLEGHDNWVRQVVGHPSGQYLISCSDDRSIRTWNVLTGTCERVIETAHSQFVTCLAVDNKNILASASLDATIKLWACYQEQQGNSTNEMIDSGGKTPV